jgi:ankyrin repeat protein
LAIGAEVNAKDTTYGGTALIWAAQKGHMEVVKFLLERGADVHAKAVNGATALIIAAQNDRTGIVKLLLEKGADVNAKANDGGTALTVAAQYGCLEIVKLLNEKGAEANSKVTHKPLFELWVKDEAVAKDWLKMSFLVIKVGKEDNMPPETIERITAQVLAGQYKVTPDASHGGSFHVIVE